MNKRRFKKSIKKQLSSAYQKMGAAEVQYWCQHSVLAASIHSPPKTLSIDNML